MRVIAKSLKGKTMTWNRVEASKGNILKLSPRKQVFPRNVDVFIVKVEFYMP
jgi:hypothetical protein